MNIRSLALLGALVGVALTGTIAAPSAHATMILSGVATAGVTVTCQYVAHGGDPGFGATCPGGKPVLINEHPAWQQQETAKLNPGDLTPAGAKWISFGPTGYNDLGPNGSHPTPKPSTLTPSLVITDQFVLVSGGTASFRAWGDDTLNFYVNDVLQGPSANFTQDTCAKGPPGCEPGELLFVTTNLSAGLNTIRFEVFQVGGGGDNISNPFGLLYIGEVPQVAVSEPGTISILGAFMGTGLVTLAYLRRRRGTAAA